MDSCVGLRICKTEARVIPLNDLSLQKIAKKNESLDGIFVQLSNQILFHLFFAT